MITISLFFGLVLAAQDSLPRRPALEANADTNDAQSYYLLAMDRVRRNPREAANAFYWANRLDPECAGCPYGRYAAQVLQDRERLIRYFIRRPGQRDSAAFRDLDSLRSRSLVMDPFLYRRLDAVLLRELARELAPEASERLIEMVLMRADSFLAGLIQYGQGRFSEATYTWGELARGRPKNAYIRVERARAFFLQQRYDSARAQLVEGLTIARRQDADSIRFSYESKAAWEYSLGRIYQVMGQHDSARAAYERALVEDLSYAAAHVQLGLLHAARADTAAALREMARAVAVNDREYVPRLTYGWLLASAGRLDSAEVHVQRAAELEPWAARPRMLLGAVRDARGDAAGALTAFIEYLARAARSDEDLPTVRARVAELRASRQ